MYMREQPAGERGEKSSTNFTFIVCCSVFRVEMRQCVVDSTQQHRRRVALAVLSCQMLIFHNQISPNAQSRNELVMLIVATSLDLVCLFFANRFGGDAK